MKIYVPLGLCLLSTCIAGPIEERRPIDGAVGLRSPTMIASQHSIRATDSHQGSSPVGQGTFGYDHYAQAAKGFEHENLAGFKHNFAYSPNSAVNQGVRGTSQVGDFHQAAHLAGVSNFFQAAGFPGLDTGAVQNLSGFTPGPIDSIPASPFSTGSSKESFQQGSSSSGQSQTQGSWALDYGQSGNNSSGNKETFSNKESFGNETSSTHAIGASQNSHAQSSEAGHYDKGHRVEATFQGNSGGVAIPHLLGGLPTASVHSTPVDPNSNQLLANLVTSNGTVHQFPQPSFIPVFSSLRGERFSNGSLENSQTSGSSSTGYNTGSTKSTSFSTKESSNDKQLFGDKDNKNHSQTHEHGNHEESGSGSRFEERDREQKIETINA